MSKVEMVLGARGYLILAAALLLAACSRNIVTWKEEVELSDGRVITVTQKRRCKSAYEGPDVSSCTERESWLTFRLPEFGDKEITWNEKLTPLVLNLHENRLYVIGLPATGYEGRLYGNPRPPYVSFEYRGNGWLRIAFKDIPDAIYDANLLILPPSKWLNGNVDLRYKSTIDGNRNPRVDRVYKRIDPHYGNPL